MYKQISLHNASLSKVLPSWSPQQSPSWVGLIGWAVNKGLNLLVSWKINRATLPHQSPGPKVKICKLRHSFFVLFFLKCERRKVKTPD